MMSAHCLERLAVCKAAHSGFYARVICKTASCMGEGNEDSIEPSKCPMSSTQLAVRSPVSSSLEVNEGWFMVLGIHVML